MRYGDFVIGRRTLFIALMLLVPLAFLATGQDGSITITTSKSGYTSYSGGYSGIVQTGTGAPIYPSASHGLGLWATDVYNNRNTFSSAKTGRDIPLLRYSPTGGLVKLYDLLETGAELTGTTSSINLAAGYSQGSYQVGAAGHHILFLTSGSAASNVV